MLRPSVNKKDINYVWSYCSYVFLWSSCSFEWSDSWSFVSFENRKERRLALKSALTYKARENGIVVVENIELSSNKTKDFIKLLEDLKVTGKTLIVVKELTDNLILASRNLSNVKVIESHEINTYDVLNYNNVVITEEAVKMLEEVLR
mgnify:CR=1 FL=1